MDRHPNVFLLPLQMAVSTLEDTDSEITATACLLHAPRTSQSGGRMKSLSYHWGAASGSLAWHECPLCCTSGRQPHQPLSPSPSGSGESCLTIFMSLDHHHFEGFKIHKDRSNDLALACMCHHQSSCPWINPSTPVSTPSACPWSCDSLFEILILSTSSFSISANTPPQPQPSSLPSDLVSLDLSPASSLTPSLLRTMSAVPLMINLIFQGPLLHMPGNSHLKWNQLSQSPGLHLGSW